MSLTKSALNGRSVALKLGSKPQWPLCVIESLTLPLDCSITILEGKGKWE